MAADIPRTVSDDAADALAALDAAERELVNLRAHLERLRAHPDYSIAVTARRSAKIGAACLSDVNGLAGAAVRRAERASRHLAPVETAQPA